MKLKIIQRGRYWVLLLAEGQGWRSVGVYHSRDGAQDALLAARKYGVA